MKLHEIVEEFEEQIASIILEERYERSLTEQFFEEFAKKEAIRANNPLLQYGSHHSMAYRSADNEYPVFFARKSLNQTEIAQLHKDKKNRKYTWLFVDAYEELEDFLEKIHAYLGNSNNNNWVLSDFGSIRANDISQKDFHWLLEQSKKKKSAPNSILSNLRNLSQHFSQLEQSNKAKINYRFFYYLSQRIRHVIVHNRGKIHDVENFVSAVFQDSGIARTAELERLAHSFFIKSGPDHQVCLLEIRAKNCPLNSYHDVLEGSVTTMLAHAHLVVESVKAHERNT